MGGRLRESPKREVGREDRGTSCLSCSTSIYLRAQTYSWSTVRPDSSSSVPGSPRLLRVQKRTGAPNVGTVLVLSVPPWFVGEKMNKEAETRVWCLPPHLPSTPTSHTRVDHTLLFD